MLYLPLRTMKASIADVAEGRASAATGSDSNAAVTERQAWISMIGMAHFLFVDESGYDSGPSPYGVLGGFAIEDRDVWNLIKATHDAEIIAFRRTMLRRPW
jgi:hypothetical protein